jgi:hypothetical protein
MWAALALLVFVTFAGQAAAQAVNGTCPSGLHGCDCTATSDLIDDSGFAALYWIGVAFAVAGQVLTAVAARHQTRYYWWMYYLGLAGALMIITAVAWLIPSSLWRNDRLLAGYSDTTNRFACFGGGAIVVELLLWPGHVLSPAYDDNAVTQSQLVSDVAGGRPPPRPFAWATEPERFKRRDALRRATLWMLISAALVIPSSNSITAGRIQGLSGTCNGELPQSVSPSSVPYYGVLLLGIPAVLVLVIAGGGDPDGYPSLGCGKDAGLPAYALHFFMVLWQAGVGAAMITAFSKLPCG